MQHHKSHLCDVHNHSHGALLTRQVMCREQRSTWIFRAVPVLALLGLNMLACSDSPTPLGPVVEEPTGVIPHAVIKIQYEDIDGVDHLITHDGQNVEVYDVTRFPQIDHVFGVDGARLGDARIFQVTVESSRHKTINIAASSPTSKIMMYNSYVPPFRFVQWVDMNIVARALRFGGSRRDRFKMLHDILIGFEFNIGREYSPGYGVYDLSTSRPLLYNNLRQRQPPYLDSVIITLTGGNLYILANVVREPTHRLFRQNVYPLEEEEIAFIPDEIAVRDFFTDSREQYAYIVGAARIIQTDLTTGHSSSIDVVGRIEGSALDEVANRLYINLSDRVAVVDLFQESHSEMKPIRLGEGQLTIVSMTLDRDKGRLYMLGSDNRIYRLPR